MPAKLGLQNIHHFLSILLIFPLALTQGCGGSDNDWRPENISVTDSDDTGDRGLDDPEDPVDPFIPFPIAVHTGNVKFNIPSNAYIFPVTDFTEQYLLFANQEESQEFTGRLLNQAEWSGGILEVPRQSAEQRIQELNDFLDPSISSLSFNPEDFDNADENKPYFVREFIIELEDPLSVQAFTFKLLGTAHNPTLLQAESLDFTQDNSEVYTEFRLKVSMHIYYSDINVFLFSIVPETIENMYRNETDIIHDPQGVSFPLNF